MTLAEFRREMEAFRKAAHEEANGFKYPHLALERLYDSYRKFDADERVMADEVLAEWAMSEDAHVRFDALALIEDFRIVAATPALKELAKRLLSSRAPGAPYELEKINRIIEAFARD